MTTTHTFQGLSTDSKPSSRVLNPPGGSSSNIFGVSDAQPAARKPAHTGSDSSSQSSTNVSGQGQKAAAAQKSRASRNGEDSFYSVFGNYRTSDEGSDKASDSIISPINGVQNLMVEQPKRNHAKSHHFYEDTFLNIFGETGVERRKMFRSVLQNTGDSFSRIFGESSASESAITKETNSSNSTLPVSSVHSELCTETSDVSCVTSSHSVVSRPVSGEEKLEDDTASSLSSRHSLGKHVLAANRGRRQRRFSDRGAFNPITGEPYDQPQPKPESRQPTSNASESSKSETATSGTLETAASLSSGTLSGQEQHPAPDSAQSEPASQQPSPPVELGTVQPAATAAVQPDAVQPAAAQPSRSQQSGIFGGSEEAQEHRSTRVSQPPGGRSTKLW